VFAELAAGGPTGVFGGMQPARNAKQTKTEKGIIRNVFFRFITFGSL